MSTSKSSIEWTDSSWNPVRGCSRVSEGCRNCYAEKMAARFSGPGKPFHGFAKVGKAGSLWTGKVALIPEALDQPLRWKTPKRIFVNSMSDLFHEGLDFHDIAAVYGVMGGAPRHIFQILTKRPARRFEFMRWMCGLQGRDITGGFSGIKSIRTDPVMGAEIAAGKRGVRFGPRLVTEIRHKWPLPNVWEGVSVEDQSTADERIPILLQTPAAKRFVSYEPALGPVEFSPWLIGHEEAGTPFDGAPHVGGCIAYTPPLDWVIVGGESGPGARPFDTAWARSVVDQSRGTDLACFVKQLGASPYDGAFRWLRLKDRKGGDMAEWPDDLRVREFPL